MINDTKPTFFLKITNLNFWHGTHTHTSSPTRQAESLSDNDHFNNASKTNFAAKQIIASLARETEIRTQNWKMQESIWYKKFPKSKSKHAIVNALKKKSLVPNFHNPLAYEKNEMNYSKYKCKSDKYMVLYTLCIKKSFCK